MSSSVFYKFKNSVEPQRIVFNGTSISVFELKREIIMAAGLSKSVDCDLKIYPEHDLTDEYKDDTTQIMRTSTVVCVRLPAPRNPNRFARYVNGKEPIRAITKERSRPTAAPLPRAGGETNEADAEAAFFAESAQVWDAQKESLSHVKPAYNKSRRPVNVPTHDPPTGYICKRCGVKGHWIQACPTNDDPDFKPVFQAKRTTGIPRSFLKTVEKPVDEEAAKGVMLNADGEYVQVMTDTRTWDKFQEKVNASKALAATADAVNQELRERGLTCPLDEKRFVDPVKTPCCSKTYCRDCIDNALADGDLECPNCGEKEILMDDLVEDEDMVTSLKAFDAEKAKEKLEKEEKAKAESQPASTNEANSPSAIASNDLSVSNVAVKPASPANGSDTDDSASTKKRKEAPTTIQPPTAPKAMRQADTTSDLEKNFMQEMEALKNGQMPSSMPMPMPMGFNPQMGFPQQMGAYGQIPYNQQFGFNPQQMPYNPQFGPNQANMGYGMQFPPNMPSQNQNGMPQNEAYDRQPVNNRNRNRRSRAPDYRYL